MSNSQKDDSQQTAGFCEAEKGVEVFDLWSEYLTEKEKTENGIGGS